MTESRLESIGERFPAKTSTRLQESGVNEQLPWSAAVIGAFQGLSQSLGMPLVGVAAALAAHHQRQWAAENDSRNASNAKALARAKRLIDELNAKRVDMIEEIDQWAVREIPGKSEASLHTETLGSVIDRLAIGWVRAQSLTKSRSADGQERARNALRQLAELADAYDDLVRDLMTGQRRLPAWRSLKWYGAD